MKYLYIFLLAALVACKVTDKTIIGTYAESKGKKITINSDHTFNMDVGGNSTASGKWSLKGNYLLLNSDNPTYKYLDSISYKVTRNKITTPDITMWPHNVTLIYKKSKTL